MRQGVAPDRVTVIPNAWAGGVDFLDRDAARRTMGLPVEGYVAGWVGRLIRIKGPDVFVDALERLRDLTIHGVMIGDGMGLAQINAARIRAVGADGFLHIDRMPVTGFLRTHAADALVTDSASSATAYAAGIKTNNGMISVTPDSQKIYTVLEGARDMNKSTGLIATSTITHAFREFDITSRGSH